MNNHLSFLGRGRVPSCGVRGQDTANPAKPVTCQTCFNRLYKKLDAASREAIAARTEDERLFYTAEYRRIYRMIELGELA